MDWTQNLHEIETAYNLTKTKSLAGFCPLEVIMDPKKEQIVKEYYAKKTVAFNKKYGKKKDPFNVGDYVRVATEKNLFSKEFEANFSSQKYQIVRKKATVPTTYYINKPDALQRPWYKEELVLTSAPKDQILKVHFDLAKRLPKRKYTFLSTLRQRRSGG